MSQGVVTRAQEAQIISAPPVVFVYLLECADGSLYCGKTQDISRRLRQHNGEIAGGAKYTRSRRPVRLVCVEGPYQDRLAHSREGFIKKMSRDQKLCLVECWRQGGDRPLPPVGVTDNR